MGDASRMNLTSRFINEFGEDYKNRSPFKAGDKLTVVEIFLGMDDSDGFAPVKTVVLADELGQRYVLCSSHLFDPDYPDLNDITEALLEELSYDAEDEADVRRRVSEVIDNTGG
jgi:hypothetical protein